MRAARVVYVAGLGADRARFKDRLAHILNANLGPGVVAIYHPMGSEIGVGLARPVAYPRVAGVTLAFHLCSPRDLVAGFGGIAEPPATCPTVEPDIVIVPLVAVDAVGNRIGQGAGHYDRTLADLRVRRRILAVGVGWDMQRVAAVPADPWDERLDALATPSGWFDFTR